MSSLEGSNRGWDSSELWPRYRLVEPWVEGKRVLEVGTRSVRGLEDLASAGAERVVGSTPDPDRVGASFGGLRGVELVQMPPGRLDFPDQAFDVLLVVDLGVEVSAQHRFLDEARRVVADGGLWVFGYAGEAAGLSALFEEDPRGPVEPERLTRMIRRRFPSATLVEQRPVVGFKLELQGRSASPASAPAPEARTASHVIALAGDHGPIVDATLVELPFEEFERRSQDQRVHYESALERMSGALRGARRSLDLHQTSLREFQARLPRIRVALEDRLARLTTPPAPPALASHVESGHPQESAPLESGAAAPERDGETDVDTLQALLAARHEAILELRAEVDRLRGRTADGPPAAALRDQVRGLEAELAQRTLQLEALAARDAQTHEGLRAQIRNLEAALEDRERRHEERQAESEARQKAKLRELELGIAEKSARVQSLELVREALQSQVRERSRVPASEERGGAAKELEDRLVRAEEGREAAEAQARGLEERLHAVEGELEAIAQEKARLASAVTEADLELRQAHRARAAADERVSALERQVKAAFESDSKTAGALEARLRAALEEAQSAREHASQLDERLRQIKAEAGDGQQRAEQETRRLVFALENAENDRAELVARVESLETERDGILVSRKELAAESAQLRSELGRVRANGDRLAFTLVETQEEFRLTAAELEATTRLLKDRGVELETAQAAATAAGAERTALELAAQHMAGELDALRHRVGVLREERDTLAVTSEQLLRDRDEALEGQSNALPRTSEVLPRRVLERLGTVLAERIQLEGRLQALEGTMAEAEEAWSGALLGQARDSAARAKTLEERVRADGERLLGQIEVADGRGARALPSDLSARVAAAESARDELERRLQAQSGVLARFREMEDRVRLRSMKRDDALAALEDRLVAGRGLLERLSRQLEAAQQEAREESERREVAERRVVELERSLAETAPDSTSAGAAPELPSHPEGRALEGRLEEEEALVSRLLAEIEARDSEMARASARMACLEAELSAARTGNPEGSQDSAGSTDEDIARLEAAMAASDETQARIRGLERALDVAQSRAQQLERRAKEAEERIAQGEALGPGTDGPDGAGGPSSEAGGERERLLALLASRDETQGRMEARIAELERALSEAETKSRRLERSLEDNLRELQRLGGPS